MQPRQRKSFWALIVTQFFGAFNDNLLKVLVQLLVLSVVANVVFRGQLVNLATAVFDIPFLLFSMMAGRAADRIGKPQVIRYVQFWQLFVVATAVVSVLMKNIPAMMVSIFLLSTQAAFFSPAKYGIMPELMDDHELSRGNGLLNMTTFIAILVGTVAGSFLASKLLVACALLVLAAVGGLIGSFFIAPLPPAKPNEPWAWNPVTEFMANWKIIQADRGLKLGIIAVNYFWFVGAVLITNIFLYAKEMMHVGEKQSGFLLIAVTSGIALGSGLAGVVSRGKVDLRLVRVGALFMSLFAIDTMWAWHSMTRALVDFFLLGFSGGLYEVPLNAFIQWKSPAAERGRILATQNFLSFVAILIASGVFLILQSVFTLDPAQIFLALGLASLLGTTAVYVFS
jgi:acyl-[acyl-carrier-protein]-phospholipid O-acyltransferase / long-chain-fatty-acid--[acyl-carrier-protein] ligase